MRGTCRELRVVFLLVCSLVCSISTGRIFAEEEHAALTGAKSVNTVFDVRTASPKSAAILLDLIHKTFQDAAVVEKPGKHDFVVVFIGPSVKLISRNRESFSAEDNKHLDTVAEKISAMAKDGIKLEICLAAAALFGVDPSTILPEVKQVGNGWISLIGYQARDYALVPVY